MKHTQAELNKFWDNVKNNKYAENSAQYKPEIVCDDDTEQCISIPNSDGTHREVYSRKSDKEEWKVVV